MSSSSADPRLRRIVERFGPAKAVTPFPADASTRAFFRIERPDGSSRVVMIDESGGLGAHERLLMTHRLLADIGVPVPAIEGRDAELRAVLFEDLGDELLADAILHFDPREEERAYEEAASIAGLIARAGTDSLEKCAPLPGEPLGTSRLRAELSFFEEEDLARRRGLRDRNVERSVSAALDRLASACGSRPSVLAHRDFHARNLVLNPHGALGVVDFQDALLAPDVYDLASLIFDPYVSLREQTVDGAVESFLRTSRLSRASVLEGLVAVGLQRLLKALGTYSHQLVVRGKSRFGSAIPVAEARALKLAERYDRASGDRLEESLRRAGFRG